MVDVFGRGLKRGPIGPQGDEGPPGKKGDKGDPGKNGFNELFNWFPQLAVEQIRKHVNFITFLIETLSSSKNDDDSDVKIDENNRVIEWRSLNYLKHGKVIFVPISKQGSKLKKLLLPFNVHQRYGLEFKGSEQNMYTIENINEPVLSYYGKNTILTLTLLVGKNDLNIPEKNTNSEITGKEEFIISDYSSLSIYDHFRGLSLISDVNQDGTFDLYVYGVNSKENKKKIAEGLKMSWFYTVQVKWGAQIEEVDGSVRFLDSFCRIYENNKLLIEETFHQEKNEGVTNPHLYIGGINKSKEEESGKMLNSNFFTGILSNIEILSTSNEIIPTELLTFIASKQCVINDDFE